MRRFVFILCLTVACWFPTTSFHVDSPAVVCSVPRIESRCKKPLAAHNTICTAPLGTGPIEPMLIESNTEAPPPDAPSNAEIAEAFAWFDALDYPSLKDRPFVQITGYAPPRYPRDTRPDPACRYGFLLESFGNQRRVLLTNLDILALTVAETGTEGVQVTSADIAEAAIELMRASRQSPEPLLVHPGYYPGEELRESAQFLIIARACEAAGRTAVAREICVFTRGRYSDGTRTVKRVIEDAICLRRTWLEALGFLDSTVSREQMLQRFEHIVALFPNAEPERYHVGPKEIVAALRVMIDEDKAHSTKTVPSPEEMTPQERISEWIYQLRDLCNQDSGQSRQIICDIYEDPRGDSSPAALLAKAGYEAVPQLLDLLGNTGPTRMAGIWCGGACHCVTLGDCAWRLLQTIAHKEFNVYYPDQIRAWWKNFQEKGECKVMLDDLEAVANGNFYCRSEAEWLMPKHPSAAFEGICRCIESGLIPSNAATLVYMLGNLPRELVEEYLKNCLTNGNHVKLRIAAAYGLRLWNPDAAVAQMVKEWRTVARDSSEEQELIRPILYCCHAEGLNALAEGFEKRHVNFRFEVIDCLSYSDLREAPSTQARTFRAAVESFLVQQLTDTECRTGLSICALDGSYRARDPRICDFAAHVLGTVFPEEYRIDPDLSGKSQERELVRLANVWRVKCGRELLPLPK